MWRTKSAAKMYKMNNFTRYTEEYFSSSSIYYSLFVRVDIFLRAFTALSRFCLFLFCFFRDDWRIFCVEVLWILSSIAPSFWWILFLFKSIPQKHMEIRYNKVSVLIRDQATMFINWYELYHIKIEIRWEELRARVSIVWFMVSLSQFTALSPMSLARSEFLGNVWREMKCPWSAPEPNKERAF